MKKDEKKICMRCNKEIPEEGDDSSAIVFGVDSPSPVHLHVKCLADWWTERGAKLDYAFRLLKISTNLFATNTSAIIEATRQEIDTLTNAKI